MTPEQGRALAAQMRIEQIGKQLDSLDDDMFNLLRAVNDYAEIHDWGNKIVERGLDQIDGMKRRIAELQEERRQLRQQPTARAS